ncbi:hypothetical protein H2203_003930 [Taxawa tesnikishii (nom. ined.)]|nr:hypothetical protein H2203_003930 [Dothideales sp. JES 119]
MLALHGWDAYGLEISSKAVQVANDYASTQMKSPNGYNFASQPTTSRPAAGSIAFVRGDFFKRDWEVHLPSSGGFDLVYDYTFLCALAPEMREAWADRMAELVKPGGFLVCLQFPMWKEHGQPGPPGLSRGEEPAEGSGATEGGRFVREEYVKPTRSFKQSRGEDVLSVWRRK